MSAAKRSALWRMTLAHAKVHGALTVAYHVTVGAIGDCVQPADELDRDIDVARHKIIDESLLAAAAGLREFQEAAAQAQAELRAAIEARYGA